MSRVFCTGDLHGDVMSIRACINQIKNPKEDDFIIVAGDAGFEYQDYIMGQAKKTASRFPGTWIVLRGNHDSRYWSEHCDEEGYPKDNNWEIVYHNFCPYLRQKKYPNIWYLPDEGCIYQIYDYNILFIPGAYSVDKFYRLNTGRVWNPAEQLTEKECSGITDMVFNWNEKGFDIDFVIGHTFPLYTQKYYKDLFLKGLDQSTVDQSMEKWLDKLSLIYEKNPAFKQYFGGHYHDDRKVTQKYTMLYHWVANLADYQ